MKPHARMCVRRAAAHTHSALPRGLTLDDPLAGSAAILAVGGSKPVVTVDGNGRIGVEKQMVVNITCDHRVVYGAHAAEFLQASSCALFNQAVAVHFELSAFVLGCGVHAELLGVHSELLAFMPSCWRSF